MIAWTNTAASEELLPVIFGRAANIVDQLAASIITLLAQISGSRENARVSIGKHLPAWDEKAMEINRAGVPEQVDGRDLKCLATPERSHLFWKTRPRFRRQPAGTKRDLENIFGGL